MDTIKRLQIAYSGTLEAYEAPKHKWFKRLLGLFWTYKNNRIDASTRSAFYLIQAVAILKTRFGIHPEELNIHLWGSIDDKHRQWCKIYAVESYFTISGFENKVDSMNPVTSTPSASGSDVYTRMSLRSSNCDWSKDPPCMAFPVQQTLPPTEGTAFMGS